MKLMLRMSLLVLALSVSGGAILADEIAELKERVLVMRREAAELLEKGHGEESNQLTRESLKLSEHIARLAEGKQARRPEGDHPDVRNLHKRLEELHAARERAVAEELPDAEIRELSERIANTERKLDEVRKREGLHGANADVKARMKKLEHADRRLQHMRIAAENLHAAEMHDLAHEIMKKAEAMEREIQMAREEMERAHHEMNNGHEGPAREIRELQEENERLRNEIRELRQAKEKNE